MAQFHFVEDYQRTVDHLIATHPIDEAMSLAVGGDYEAIGTIECDLVRWAGLRPGMSVIDFGCGSGRLGHALGKSIDVDYLGIDIVQSLLDYAATKCPPHYRFRLNRTMTVPAPDETADFITAFSVFTHLLPSEAYIYLEDMRRVLRPGGTLLFTFLEVANPAHWGPFMGDVQARRSSASVPLNIMLERPLIVRMCGALGYSLTRFVDGTDAPWDGSPMWQSTAILKRPGPARPASHTQPTPDARPPSRPGGLGPHRPAPRPRPIAPCRGESDGVMQPLRPCPRLPAHLLEHARLLPDRDAMLPLLPRGRRWAEIGVAFGDFSQKILDTCAPESFVAIDLFRIHEMETMWGRPTAEVFDGRTHGDFYRTRFSEVIASGRMRVMEEDSAAALARLPDQSLDIAYIDADHTFDYVARELALVSRKIAADGIIILNDYIMTDVMAGHLAYGVIQATNSFMVANDWEMLYFTFQDYMYCDVAIRRRSPAQPRSLTAVPCWSTRTGRCGPKSMRCAARLRG